MLKMNKIALGNFKEIPPPCSHCLYWEKIGQPERSLTKQQMKLRRLDWLSKVITEFGDCGFVVHFDADPVGFVQYAHPRFFPNISEYLSGPPSDDAVFLACLHIVKKEARHKGLGASILRRLLSELRDEGFGAVETFSRRSSENNPSGPLRLYMKQGFRVVRERDDFPLVRYELGNRERICQLEKS